MCSRPLQTWPCGLSPALLYPLASGTCRQPPRLQVLVHAVVSARTPTPLSSSRLNFHASQGPAPALPQEQSAGDSSGPVLQLRLQDWARPADCSPPLPLPALAQESLSCGSLHSLLRVGRLAGEDQAQVLQTVEAQREGAWAWSHLAGCSPPGSRSSGK